MSIVAFFRTAKLMAGLLLWAVAAPGGTLREWGLPHRALCGAPRRAAEDNTMSRWYEDPKLDLAVRLAVAIPLLLAGLWVMVAGLRAGGLTAAFSLPLATACFVGAGVMIAPWIAERCGNLAGGLLYPDRTFDRPQPVFSIAEGKRAQGQPREALAEYEQVLLEHPQELRCYISMMDIAARDLRDPLLAEDYYRRGAGLITEPQTLRKLREARDEILRDFPSAGAC
jgi:hypothetical protein